MNITQQRMTMIFNEWALRYASNPDNFGAILDDAGLPITDYGQQCTFYFEEIADELDAAGTLPRNP